MRDFLISLINFYQKRISIFKKRSCVFYPTCSEYAKDAIYKYGSSKGICLAICRVLRCHPWQENQIDLVK